MVKHVLADVLLQVLTGNVFYKAEDEQSRSAHGGVVAGLCRQLITSARRYAGHRPGTLTQKLALFI
jgi:hypothetical protein